MKNRTQETLIKITTTHDRVEEVIDKILEIYRCSISPIRNSDRGGCFVYLTVIGEAEK